jgi:membrane protease YdiL (CAAX protease family)
MGVLGHPADDDTGLAGQPNTQGLRVPLPVIGAYGPFVAAFALSHREKSAWALFKRAFRWRIPPLVLLSALFLSPVLAGAAVWIQAMLGGPAFAFRTSWPHLPGLILLLLFLGGSFNEEFGWAFAIDRIQPRWGFLKGSLLLGVVWAFWHLPLFFMPTQAQSHMPFWTFLITCCSLRLLYVWAYNESRQSILVSLLFHTSVNFTLNLFAILDTKVSAMKQPAWMGYVVALAIPAAVIVALHVFRRGRHRG